MPAYGSRAAAARADIFDLQRDRLGSAGVRVAQIEVDRRLEILSASCDARPLRRLTAPDAGEEDVKEIGEAARCARPAEVELELLAADVGAIPALLFGLLRGLLPVRSEYVVFLALLGIAQDFVGLGNLLEFLLGLFRIIGIGVGMPLARELAIGGLDIFLGSVLWNAQDRIVVPEIHSAECLATITFAG